MSYQNDGSRVARKQRSRTRAVEASVVPGFPEIVGRNRQCRLCGLIESNPVLLHRIHEAFQSGKGVRALETEMTPVFEEAGQAPLNVKCFSRHFKSHVSFVAAAAVALPVEAPVRPATPPPPIAPAAAPEMNDEDALEAAAYFDMRNLISKLRIRMETIDQSTAFVDENGKINSYGLQLWLKFVDSFRSALEAMNRIKNNDRLTRAIIQAHAKRQMQLASAQLIARFEVLLAKIRRGDADALADLEQFAMSDAKQIVLETARAAVEESCEVYRLH